MRLEFQIRRAGSSDALVDAAYTPLEKACAAVTGEPAWLDFFASPRTVTRPYPASGGRPGGYSREETLAALEALRAAIRAGADPDGLEPWLGWAVDAVKGQPAGTRFESFVMDD